MVSTHFYEDQGDQGYRLGCRYSSRDHGYSIGQERDLSSAQLHGVYPGARSQRLSPQENRDHSTDNDSNTRARSRIPVACGRCRKRKIRCSGDNGGPCTNCKTAGHQECQFHRVSSIDYPLKSDLPQSDDYSGAGARLIFRNVPYGSQAYGPHNTLPIDNYAYRSNSIPTPYQYSSRQSYAPTYGPTYAHEGLDYDIDATSYGLLPVDSYPISNYTTSNVREWTPATVPAPAPRLPKHAMYLDHSDTAYSQPSSLYPANGYRISIGTEQKLPLTSMPPQLPAPLPTTGVDRILPYPAANRPAQVASFLRSNDGLPYASFTGLGLSSNHDYTVDRVTKPTHGSSISDSSVSESPAPLMTSYLTPSNNSTESFAAHQMQYNSQQLALEQQNSDDYTPRNIQHQPYEQGPLNSSYRHGGSFSRHVQQVEGQSEEQVPTSQTQEEQQHIPSVGDNLVNGHQYVPYKSPAYPQPPVGIPGQIPTQFSSPVSPVSIVNQHSPVMQHQRRYSTPKEIGAA